MFTFTGLARIIFTSFLRYNVYSENSAQKHYFEFKKNYEEIPRRSNKNSRHMLLDQYVKITLRLKRNVLIKTLSRINVSASMIRFPFCSKVRIRNHFFLSFEKMFTFTGLARIIFTSK